MVDENGNRNVPYFNNDGKSWYVNLNRLTNDFNRNDRIALSSKRQ
jgi:hypothetical protein